MKRKSIAWLMTAALIFGSVSPAMAEETLIIEAGGEQTVSEGPKVGISEKKQNTSETNQNTSGASQGNQSTSEVNKNALAASFEDLELIPENELDKEPEASGDNINEESNASGVNSNEASNSSEADANDQEILSDSIVIETIVDGDGNVLYTGDDAEEEENVTDEEEDVTDEEEDVDDTCGENLDWELDEDNGILYINGTGDMYDWGATEDDVAPWYYDNSVIERIVIGSGVTSIGASAFQDCCELTYISMSSTVTKIGDYAFLECENLPGITLPSGLTAIGEGAFADCYTLDLSVPSSVTFIGAHAFSGTAIDTITIPAGVTSIEDSLFYECYDLVTVTINGNVTSIGDYAFWDCVALENFTIPDSVTDIGAGAFLGCTALENDNLVIPSEVTVIEDETFWGCTSLTEMVIPEGVTSIGDDAFGSCTALESIQLPEKSLEYLGLKAFDKCRSLEKIVIPEGVTAIEDECFSGCSKLTSAEIPESVTSIGVSAFADCSQLADIVIPEAVTTIGNYAFADCGEMIAACFAGTAPSVWGTDVFTGCNEEFHIYYIQDTEGWTKPDWTEPTTGITYQTGLWGGKCGDSSSVFENVQWRFWFRDAALEMYGSGNTNDWADAEVPWITCYPYISKLVVGEGIEYLGSNAFKNCTSLNQVTFPETLLTVSGEVFYGCGISEITLPSKFFLLLFQEIQGTVCGRLD